MSPVKKIALACALSAAVLLAGCGSNTNQSAGPSEAASSSAMPTKASGVAAAKPSPTPEPTPDKPEAGILEVGFGQRDQYVTGVAIIQAGQSELVRGAIATVSFNFLDEAGEIVGTAEQREVLHWPGQKLSLAALEDLGEYIEVASVDAVVSVSEGFNSAVVEPLEPLPMTDIVERPGDVYDVKFHFENGSGDNLENLRFGVYCRNSEGTLIGGGYQHLSLVGANAKALVTAHLYSLSGIPDVCEATVNY